MPVPKPTTHLDWATDVGAQVTEPSVAKKATGWVPDERPPAQFFNWNTKLQDEWNKYFEQEIGSAVASWDAIVGTFASFPEATHETLEDVMADGAVPNGSRILVLEDRTVDATITLNKLNIEVYFKPAVTYTKGTATQAFQIAAEGVKIINGQFRGFTTGGDVVFGMLGTAPYCVYRDCRFAVNTDTEIDDSAVNNGQKPRIETMTEI